MNTIRINDFKNYKISDSDVVRRVLSGEKELYEILMRRHNQTLFRVLRGYLKNEEEVQDVMQDTYLRAYEKLYQFKHESKFSTWLIRIGINEALTRIKSKDKEKLRVDEGSDIHAYETSELSEQAFVNPERKMIRKEAIQILEQSIDQLNTKYRSVYIMREVEELNIKEIAEALDLSEANVKVRIHRAKAMIKEELYQLSKSEDLFEFGFNKCDNLVERVMSVIY
ncbi:MAG: RNA polymerase sigma factor [Balneolaceae bacterium]